MESPGWDRILTYEAFPHTEKNRIRRRIKYIIPVFILNKLNGDDAVTTIAMSDVMQSYKHCMRFLEERISLADGFHFLSRKNAWFSNKSKPSESDFILILVTKSIIGKDTIASSPPNVLFCSHVELDKMYGPPWRGFLSSMRHDVSVSAVTK